VGEPTTSRRSAWTAALLALPAVAAALGLTAIEVYRVADPAAALFGEPPARSIAEAIRRGRGVEQVYAFIRSGLDPNERVTVRDSDYTGGETIEVSPLLLAVASRDANVVQMLLEHGVRLDLPQNRYAWCLARDMGHDETAGVLLDHGASQVCPASAPGAATPLVGWAAR
jgi:hypothetical protein